MIELRCRFKKAVEIDPKTFSIVYRCQTCSKNAGTDVFHQWPIDRIKDLIESGATEGVMPPGESKAP